ncbi:4-hydroxythreonine-4-phosphate dehydrogenase [Leptospira congkakensis]|uniref:4-hydroxythreonine-4-phosphate dehydrogenase n=1 Tax=Leptospira congkakensis TaxID=2484932 RepID=A0A4Z1A2K1_9LEPT|nr:4-hydroxythreonine-4-phosphate dehydrogenase PdxA [Leptospira congkakensis]TGL87920.1 4-hydroxythreonine-4-phosphate dehydrogenase [Leptospira congkakensis]TGL92697.1 4-hydroxythreonine-4-phosphate dehydrogenase [Leptospira congkakensis]TGL96070.1 4-hydroxythreonine-4-phosphate dehydrogenase [Leptospira congkakensis]
MKTILISEGDPTSINYELVVSAFPHLLALGKHHRIYLVRGPHNQNIPSLPNLTKPSNEPGFYALSWKDSKKTRSFVLGKPSKTSGQMAYDSLLAAMDLQKELGADLITLPLSKEWVQKAGIKGFRGHTETLAEYYKRPTFMMMSGEKLNVIPLTTHVPLKDVVKELKKFSWTELSKALTRSPFLKNPKIAYLGLNPHAGEGGKIGDEELTILAGGIKVLRKAKFSVEGPLSADSAFLPGARAYDLYLAGYHDQGLIPFKLLEGKKGVNITLGLDFTRVSPDHGTAFDIAGKGKADPTGLISCLERLTENTKTNS